MIAIWLKTKQFAVCFQFFFCSWASDNSSETFLQKVYNSMTILRRIWYLVFSYIEYSNRLEMCFIFKRLYVVCGQYKRYLSFWIDMFEFHTNEFNARNESNSFTYWIVWQLPCSIWFAAWKNFFFFFWLFFSPFIGQWRSYVMFYRSTFGLIFSLL